jgi:hypothetical protein
MSGYTTGVFNSLAKDLEGRGSIEVIEHGNS